MLRRGGNGGQLPQHTVPSASPYPCMPEHAPAATAQPSLLQASHQRLNQLGNSLQPAAKQNRPGDVDRWVDHANPPPRRTRSSAATRAPLKRHVGSSGSQHRSDLARTGQVRRCLLQVGEDVMDTPQHRILRVALRTNAVRITG